MISFLAMQDHYIRLPHKLTFHLPPLYWPILILKYLTTEFSSSFDCQPIWSNCSTPSEFTWRKYRVFVLKLYNQREWHDLSRESLGALLESYIFILWYWRYYSPRRMEWLGWPSKAKVCINFMKIYKYIIKNYWWATRLVYGLCFRTAVFGEFQCKGDGANTTRRVPWAKSFNVEDARPFLDMEFIDGNKWLRL